MPMNWLKKISFLLLTVTMTISFGDSYGQDIHFSQFYNSPLSLTPAFTGYFTGDWRVSNNYRTQWRSVAIPYNTVSVGYDRKFKLFYQNFGGGIYIVNDNSGYAHLTVNKIYLSGAFHKLIGKNEIHIGIQPGYVFSNFGKDGITFPDQYDPGTGGFNEQLPSGENNLNDKLSYLDINIGGAWNGEFGKLKPLAAISVFHINNPKQSFLGEDNHLPLRTVLYGGGIYPLNDKWSLLPHLLYMLHKNANEFLLGSNADMKLPENGLKIKSIYGGLLYRDGFNFKMDAVIGIVGLKFKNFDMGLSYDFNISHLKVATNSKGALEFSLIYTNMASFINKITFPCDRY